MPGHPCDARMGDERLEVQQGHGLMVCDMEGIAYDRDAADEFPELLATMRIKIANDLA